MSGVPPFKIAFLFCGGSADIIQRAVRPAGGLRHIFIEHNGFHHRIGMELSIGTPPAEHGYPLIVQASKGVVDTKILRMNARLKLCIRIPFSFGPRGANGKRHAFMRAIP